MRDIAFHAETKEGVKLKFASNKKSLHYLECKEYVGVRKLGRVFGKDIVVPAIVKGTSLHNNYIEAILTIEGNQKNYFNHDVAQAEAILCFQHVGVHISNSIIHHVVVTNRINGFPIVREDDKLMNDILEKNPYNHEDNVARRQPNAVETDIISLPKSISKHYTGLTLCIDMILVIRVPLDITIFRKIHYRTVYGLPSIKISGLKT